MARTPVNQSRGSGQRAPTSAAATEPPSGPFYQGSDKVDDAELAAPPTTRAGFRTEFTETVRSGSMPIEQGGSVDREVAEHMAADAIHDPDDLAAEIERIRKIRKPIGAYSQKLALPTRSGYHRHWFNDTAGRIDEAESNGWAHVLGKDNKPISRCVGSGRDKGALYAFAMEIPEVFWLEDQAARNQAATDKMEGLKGKPFMSRPGEAKAADRGKFYDPTESETPLQIVKN